MPEMPLPMTAMRRLLWAMGGTFSGVSESYS
jgi:hypothetical protein